MSTDQSASTSPHATLDGYDYGRPDEFEIVWRSGAVDRFLAHQVTHPNNAGMSLFGASAPNARRIIQFHGCFDNHWRCVLIADEDDMHSVRNVTRMGDAR